MENWIELAISVLVFLGTLITVGVKMGRLQAEVREGAKQNEIKDKELDRMRNEFATKENVKVVSDRLAEDRLRNDKRIEELYQSRNEMGRQMERVVTLIEGLGARFDGVEKKIDELKKGGGEV